LTIKLAVVFWIKQRLQGKDRRQYRNIAKGFKAAQGVSGRKER
jgi:hypothetical protein